MNAPQTILPSNFTDPTTSAFGIDHSWSPWRNPSTPVGRRKKNSKKNNNHDSSTSKSDAMEYCVYGTLLVTCLIILLSEIMCIV